MPGLRVGPTILLGPLFERGVLLRVEVGPGQGVSVQTVSRSSLPVPVLGSPEVREVVSGSLEGCRRGLEREVWGRWTGIVRYSTQRFVSLGIEGGPTLGSPEPRDTGVLFWV